MESGFEILSGFYEFDEIEDINAALNKKGVFTYKFIDADGHNLFRSIEEVSTLAKSEKLCELVRNIIGNAAVPFHAIVLDKTKENNWGLDWHQDLKIAVRKRITTEGYAYWSIEAGIWHVVPPASILRGMLTVRIHLDDSNSSNGSIWMIPGSQKSGIIESNAIADIVKKGKIYDCEVKRGDIVLMSPLTLHKSPYSLSTQQRRVLQIQYRATELDGGLEWRD